MKSIHRSSEGCIYHRTAAKINPRINPTEVRQVDRRTFLVATRLKPSPIQEYLIHTVGATASLNPQPHVHLEGHIGVGRHRKLSCIFLFWVEHLEARGSL
jgi:hypothetical protein